MTERARDFDLELSWGLPRETTRRVLLCLALFAYFVVGFRLMPALTAGRATSLRLFLDDRIPFLPWTAYLYASLCTVMIYPVFVVRCPRLFSRTSTAYFALLSISFVCYFVFPVTSVGFRPDPSTLDDRVFCEWGLKLNYALDEPYNLFPSLHLSAASIAMLAAWKASPRMGALILRRGGGPFARRAEFGAPRAAVLRTRESFGIQEVHAIARSYSFHPNSKISQGVEKWLDLYLYRESERCLSLLKQRGYLLCATHLGEGAVSLLELPADRPLALIFGTEKVGVTGAVLSACDVRFKIPMLGFSQSFNISVAAAICMSHLVFRRLGAKGPRGGRSPCRRAPSPRAPLLRALDQTAPPLVHRTREWAGGPTVQEAMGDAMIRALLLSLSLLAAPASPAPLAGGGPRDAQGEGSRREAGGAPASPAAPDPEVKRAVDRMQRFYEETKDFTATFQQNYRHKGFPPQKASGTVRFKKRGGSMRWDYLKPDEKVFVISGKKIFTFDKEAKQLTVASVDTDRLSASITFFWGQGKLERESDIRKADRKDLTDGIALELIPKAAILGSERSSSSSTRRPTRSRRAWSSTRTGARTASPSSM